MVHLSSRWKLAWQLGDMMSCYSSKTSRISLGTSSPYFEPSSTLMVARKVGSCRRTSLDICNDESILDDTFSRLIGTVHAFSSRMYMVLGREPTRPSPCPRTLSQALHQSHPWSRLSGSLGHATPLCSLPPCELHHR